MPTHHAPDAVQRALGADCGCGPTDTEQRAMWGPVSRRSAFGLAAVGIAGAAVIAAAGPGSALPAYAVDYPSWDDVEKAKGDEAAKAAEVTRIEGMIKQLQADVARTKAAAETAGQEYFEAQQAYELARARAELLQSQADEQEKTATEAAKKAGQVAAQLYRNGGDDTALQLFFSGSAASADDMLSKLGQMDRLLEHNKSVYESAVKARNSARSLSDQAKVQRTERDKLQKAAQEKLEKAQTAQQQAQDALTTQNANLDTLQAQLAALKDNTTKVVKDYEAGVEARRKAEEEARRKAEEEARRLAEEARKRQEENNTTSPDPWVPPTNNTPTSTGSDGWVKPHYGSVTSGYGPRYSECGPSYCMSSFHAGLDIAAGCGSAIYAAKSGTVTFAGYNGGYGNYIRIDHGGAYGTGYAHIVDGGILVGYGQYVNAGDLIGLEGDTGNSFGCHTHFEVYVWGDTVDPQPFLAERGIYY